MIALIKGKVVANNGALLVVLTAGGVGYKIAVNPARAESWPVGNEIEILTHLIVREDTQDLYGFASESERRLFLYFLSVSGVGPKTALHLLSLGTIEEITDAIARNDAVYLTKVSGIGRKTAEKIVVELKDKIAGVGHFTSGSENFGNILGDVVDGLVSLGYTQLQARDAVKTIDIKGKTSERLLREALQLIK